jgi:hypothetical protein
VSLGLGWELLSELSAVSEDDRKVYAESVSVRENCRLGSSTKMTDTRIYQDAVAIQSQLRAGIGY